MLATVWSVVVKTVYSLKIWYKYSVKLYCRHNTYASYKRSIPVFPIHWCKCPKVFSKSHIFTSHLYPLNSKQSISWNIITFFFVFPVCIYGNNSHCCHWWVSNLPETKEGLFLCMRLCCHVPYGFDTHNRSKPKSFLLWIEITRKNEYSSEQLARDLHLRH